MPVANINGVRIYYEVSGTGLAVMLCHGFSGSHQDWLNQVAVLSPRFRVVTMDSRGHGSSEAPASAEAYAVALFAQDVRVLLGLMGVKKAIVGGHSMGGFIALQLALDHPELVSALMLVDTCAGEMDMPPEAIQARLKALELAQSQGLEAAFEHDAAHNPIRQEYFRRHPQMRDYNRQHTLEMSALGYVHAWGAIRGWHPVTSRLGEIKVPTLIIVGDEDTPFLRPVRVLEQGIAGAKLVTVPGCGHSPHIESPAAVNSALLDFLSRVK